MTRPERTEEAMKYLDYLKDHNPTEENLWAYYLASELSIPVWRSKEIVLEWKEREVAE